MNGPGVPSFAEAPAKSARCEPRLWSPSHFNILPATATSPWAAALRLSRMSHKCEPCGRATWMRAFSARLSNMIVIQVDVDQTEVHVRGLTPEPFGAGRTLLERQSTGS